MRMGRSIGVVEVQVQLCAMKAIVIVRPDSAVRVLDSLVFKLSSPQRGNIPQAGSFEMSDHGL